VPSQVEIEAMAVSAAVIGTTAMVGCAHLVSVPAAAAIVSGGHFQKTETNET
jgi:hypothetical protein